MLLPLLQNNLLEVSVTTEYPIDWTVGIPLQTYSISAPNESYEVKFEDSRL